MSVWTGRNPYVDSVPRLEASYVSGTETVLLFDLEATRPPQPYRRHEVVLSDPLALTNDFRLRIAFPSTIDALYQIDDVTVVCDPDTNDDDGDGFANWQDCDDLDPDHWLDCGGCIDGDGDQMGAGCDLGDDCDDDDVDTYPGAPDTAGDGVDNSCSTVDGPGFSDTLLTSELDPRFWDTSTREGYVGGLDIWFQQTTFARHGSVVESLPIDLTGCPSIEVSWQSKSVGVNSGDRLELDFWNGTDWITAGRRRGENPDPDGNLYPYAYATTSGNLPPEAFISDLRIRIRNPSIEDSGTPGWLNRNLFLGCGGTDSDGDGIDVTRDCDDNDPTEWALCTQCVDADGDGRGTTCDLGRDCDDTNAAVYLGAPDLVGDGIDSDCSGTDGPGWADDFARGAYEYWVWGDTEGYLRDVSSGSVTAVRIGGQSYLTTRALDVSGCSSLTWTADVRNVGSSGELVFEYFDGEAYRVAETLSPAAASSWTVRSGPIADADALRSDFRFRVRNAGFDPTGGWDIEDVAVGCGGPDGDGDGVASTLDCDDTDALLWSACGTCVDADGDGRGVDCDLGFDCDDADSTVYLGAADTVGDGIDSDCNGYDDPGLFDDGESTDLADVWRFETGDVTVSTAEASSGSQSLDIDATGEIETVEVDLSSCSQVLWTYDVKRGPTAPALFSDLVLTYWDGSEWVEADRVSGGSSDPDFQLRWGLISDPTALRDDFRMRLRNTGIAADQNYFVDDFTVVCGGSDSDGDGVPAPLDCASSDANLWFACATCIDIDGDGHGIDCDLPGDCDEGSASVYVGAPDLLGDGIDQDCDGADGAAFVVDDFESGALDATQWASSVSTSVLDIPEDVFEGSWSLRMQPNSELVSNAFDASVCNELAYQVAFRPRNFTRLASIFAIEYSTDNGASYQLVEQRPSWFTDEVPFEILEGVFPTAALTTNTQVRFAAADWSTIDEVVIGCSNDDGDGDGVPSVFDCDDSDPDRWRACLTCQDADLDGFGTDCDLADDCDDSDATRFPGAVDTLGNGIDEDCSGADGPGFFDDFERERIDPVAWDLGPSTIAYGVTWDAFAGAQAGAVSGGGALVSQPLDTTGCPTVAYSVQGLPARLRAGSGFSYLQLEYWNGTGWVLLDEIRGAYRPYQPMRGAITAADAKRTDFRIRMVTDTTSVDRWGFFDDVHVTCAPADGDGDGLTGPIDCDDTDADLWSACLTCVDNDGDGFGDDCDLGYDCDDTDALIAPGLPDLGGDGVDSDCTGVDGPGVLLDFEDGAEMPTAVDSFISGAVASQSDYVGSGSYSLRVSAGGFMRSVPQDMSGCTAIDWSYDHSRGPFPPSSGAFVYFRWLDNGAVVGTDILQLSGNASSNFWQRSGQITDPLALSSSAQFELLVARIGGGASGTLYFDDIEFVCVP